MSATETIKGETTGAAGRRGREATSGWEIREQASLRRWHLNRPEVGKGMIHTDLQQPGEQPMQRP